MSAAAHYMLSAEKLNVINELFSKKANEILQYFNIVFKTTGYAE